MPEAHELYGEGDLLKDEGKLPEAIEKFQAALEVDKEYATAHLALAVVYGRVGKHDEAVKHGELACELEPNDAFNYTALSVTYQRAYAGSQDMKYIQLAEDAKAKAQMIQGHPH